MSDNPYNLEPVEEGVEKKMQEKFVAEKPGAKESPDMPKMPEKKSERQQESAAEQSMEAFLAKAKAQMASDASGTNTQAVVQDAGAVSEEDEESRVSKLIALAKDKGPAHAFEVALKLDDLYVVDRLHDTLSGKLYDELAREGILKGE